MTTIKTVPSTHPAQQPAELVFRCRRTSCPGSRQRRFAECFGSARSQDIPGCPGCLPEVVRGQNSPSDHSGSAHVGRTGAQLAVCGSVASPGRAAPLVPVQGPGWLQAEQTNRPSAVAACCRCPRTATSPPASSGSWAPCAPKASPSGRSASRSGCANRKSTWALPRPQVKAPN